MNSNPIRTPPRQLRHSRATLAAVLTAAVLLVGCGAGEDDVDGAASSFQSTPIVAVDTPPPAYPIELACADIGGEVVLAVTIGVDGRPSQIRLKQSSGVEQLDAVAQEAVRAWKFRAATANGQAVERTIEVPMTFNPPDMRPQRCFVLEDQQ